MFNLLIVEDELMTRECLKSYIPWKEIGIENIQTANNGEHALEVIKSFTPDILLCDVRMPRMNGIELSHQIKKMFPNCKIVFISGYADKEYLMSAIQLNALNYIEKPLNIDEITQTMKKVVEICIKEKEKENLTKKLLEMFNDNAVVIHQTIANEMLKQNPDLSLLEKYGIDTQQLFILIVLFLESDYEMDIYKNDILENILSQNHFLNQNFYITIDKDILYIIAQDEDMAFKSIDHIRDKIKSFNPQISTTVGVMNKKMNISELNVHLKDLISYTQFKRFYEGKGTIYSYESIDKNSRFDLDNRIFSDFEKDLRHNNLDEAKKMVENITKQIYQLKINDIEKIKGIYLEMLFRIYQVGRERGITIELDKDERENWWKTIDKIPSLKELEAYLISLIDDIFNLLKNRNKFDKKIMQIIDYINNNFSDKNLTIQKIANHFYFSPNYLCSIFKKAVGVTINDYITDVRIEKAKEYLKDSTTKLYEVADKVGFTDPNYFSSIFKKKVGVNPSTYKERFYP